MSDYTEGPWELADGCFLYKIDPDTGCNRFWANFTPVDWANEEEAKANARLCKAAPDLLEALEEAAAALETAGVVLMARKCREVIKKARGER